MKRTRVRLCSLNRLDRADARVCGAASSDRVSAFNGSNRCTIAHLLLADAASDFAGYPITSERCSIEPFKGYFLELSPRATMCARLPPRGSSAGGTSVRGGGRREGARTTTAA